MNKVRIPQLLIPCFLIFITVFSCSKRSDFEIRNDKMNALIKTGSDSISAPAYFPDSDVRKYLHKEFNEFYKNRSYSLAWLDFHQPKNQADELLEALDKAPRHGLRPLAYNVNKIEELLGSLYNIDSKKERRKKWRRKLVKTKEYKKELQEADTLRFQQIAQLDFLLTASYLTYASHLLSGRIDPNEDKVWFATRRKENLSKHLEDAITSREIKESLETLAPLHKHYQALQEYLIHFQKITQPAVPEVTHNLKTGDKGEQVIYAKKRLKYWRSVNPDMRDSATYNNKMKEAVKLFQEIHGLTPSGEIDKTTRMLINRPLAYWMEKIETNMERMRWLPWNESMKKYVLINIPAYELKVINNEEVDIKMKIIVGTEYNRTPVFSDTLEYIVFNPTWTVPNSIATEEMLPGIKRNPEEYLSKRNLRLYDSWKANAEPLDPKEIDWSEIDSADWRFRLVESPGPTNSLGRIKFMMPNSEAIYLHDTPANHLFSKQDRTFSHGCIRLERPLDFAEYLLKWDREKLLKKLDDQETENVTLEEELPVHIVYWSAWVDEKGLINFREDVYSYDKKQKEKIMQKEKEIISSP